MKRSEYKPKEYKELVSRLLKENHQISSVNGLPRTFYSSTQGVDILSNFDNIFNSFINQFPLTNMLDHDYLVFTFKVLLQQQLDSYWYSGYKRYKTNIEIYNDKELIDFRKVKPRFKYLKVKPGKEFPIKLKKLYLRIRNSSLRNCSGMFLPYAPVPMYNFLNKLCRDLNEAIVITNTLRSSEYQNKLLNEGYIAPSDSSHLYGYTVDIEQLWYKKNRPKLHEKIEHHLHKLEDEGQLTFIDYGQIWHICLSPYFLGLYSD